MAGRVKVKAHTRSQPKRSKAKAKPKPKAIGRASGLDFMAVTRAVEGGLAYPGVHRIRKGTHARGGKVAIYSVGPSNRTLDKSRRVLDLTTGKTRPINGVLVQVDRATLKAIKEWLGNGQRQGPLF
jgi:hypothetical protein